MDNDLLRVRAEVICLSNSLEFSAEFESFDASTAVASSLEALSTPFYDIED